MPVRKIITLELLPARLFGVPVCVCAGDLVTLGGTLRLYNADDGNTLLATMTGIAVGIAVGIDATGELVFKPR